MSARGIYRMHVITGSLDWERRFKETKNYINCNSAYTGHVLSSANDSRRNKAIVLIFSWQNELANSIYYQI